MVAMTEFGPPGTLDGRRIQLRPFRIDDADAVAHACADPAIPRYTMVPVGLTVARAREWIERRAALWRDGLFSLAISVPPHDTCIGEVGVHVDLRHRRAEMFYWLSPTARGSGFATEALDTVTRWAFETHGVARAQLITHIDNTASQRVAERCGYQREGVLRAWEPIEDQQPDVVMWSRLPGDPEPEPAIGDEGHRRS